MLCDVKIAAASEKGQMIGYHRHINHSCLPTHLFASSKTLSLVEAEKKEFINNNILYYYYNALLATATHEIIRVKCGFT